MMLRLLGKFFTTATIVLIIVGTYYYRDSITVFIKNGFKIIQPCTEPLTYTIGAFDERFGLSKEAFLAEIQKSEYLWENPVQKELFAYVESDADITINLIYDHRQEVTDQLKEIGILIDNDQESYESLKKRHTALINEHDETKKILNQKSIAFEAEKRIYEAEVRYYNQRGGAPEQKYNELNEKKKVLDQKVAEINALVKSINELVNEVNTNAGILNQLAKNLNLNVNNYNTVGSSAGNEFREGEYIQDGFTRTINIYQFSNIQQLLRVMAHELGHAIGVSHLNNPLAIMYYLNEGSNETATGDDIDALKLVCNIE